jgi:hypothetical protein
MAGNGPYRHDERIPGGQEYPLYQLHAGYMNLSKQVYWFCMPDGRIDLSKQACQF